jgi:hypothetical protein
MILTRCQQFSLQQQQQLLESSSSSYFYPLTAASLQLLVLEGMTSTP